MRFRYLLLLAALCSAPCMADCTVGEYSAVKTFSNENVQVAAVLVDEDMVTTNASTVVEYAGDNNGGVRINTILIRLKCDEKTHFVIGPATDDPTPTTSSQWVTADETEYLGIAPGETIGLLENA